jgi:hypothetical protein
MPREKKPTQPLFDFLGHEIKVGDTVGVVFHRNRSGIVVGHIEAFDNHGLTFSTPPFRAGEHNLEYRLTRSAYERTNQMIWIGP